jgi:molybdopterin-binding protein
MDRGQRYILSFIAMVIDGLALEEGDAAVAIIKSSSVILGVAL